MFLMTEAGTVLAPLHTGLLKRSLEACQIMFIYV
jgi:hypothetical protein